MEFPDFCGSGRRRIVRSAAFAYGEDPLIVEFIKPGLSFYIENGVSYL